MKIFVLLSIVYATHHVSELLEYPFSNNGGKDDLLGNLSHSLILSVYEPPFVWASGVISKEQRLMMM